MDNGVINIAAFLYMHRIPLREAIISNHLWSGGEGCLRARSGGFIFLLMLFEYLILYIDYLLTK